MNVRRYANGDRVRILRDNGRDGIVGYEGRVVLVVPSGVVVVIENDPALRFRMYNTGFARPRPIIRRFFYPGDVEYIERV